MSGIAKPSELDAALRDFRDMMRADGYVVGWELSGPDAIVVKVEATDGACSDCLVPTTVMQAIISSALEGTGVSVDHVALPAAH